MPQVGEQRFAPGDCQDHSAQHEHRAERAHPPQEDQSMPGIRGGQDSGSRANLAKAQKRDHKEPGDHHHSENPSYGRRAPILDGEQTY